MCPRTLKAIRSLKLRELVDFRLTYQRVRDRCFGPSETCEGRFQSLRLQALADLSVSSRSASEARPTAEASDKALLAGRKQANQRVSAPVLQRLLYDSGAMRLTLALKDRRRR